MSVTESIRETVRRRQAGTKADMAEWTGCIAGALTDTEFTQALTTAGFTDIEIRLTHRVHAHAQAAIIGLSVRLRL